MEVHNQAYRPIRPDPGTIQPRGLSPNGVSEEFSTQPPVSLYGSSKVASELLALEYGETFGFPVWINRCGVLAGAGQFGRPDQGIFSFWINSYLRRKPLKYIGFGGTGYQVRDCLHPQDLVPMLVQQMSETGKSEKQRVQNLSGGIRNSLSLAQLSAWCADRFGSHEVTADLTPRPFDIPWMILDSQLAKIQWDWEPATEMDSILTEIADHAEQNTDWLELSLA